MNLASRMKEALAVHGAATRAAARALGCSAGHLSRVLRGVRRPSKKLLQAFEGFVDQDLGRLVHERKKGRPKRGGTAAKVRQAFGVPVPARVTPPLRMAFRLACYTPAGREMVELLDRSERPGWFWKPVKSVAGLLNGNEQGLFMNLLLDGGDPKELHPRHVGFPLPVLERPDHWWLAVVLEKEDFLAVVFPQLEVCTGRNVSRRLDFVVAAAAGDGTVVHCNVEVDGPQHRGQKVSDRAREAEIGLRTLRLTAEQAFDRSTPRKLLKWVATALEHERGS